MLDVHRPALLILGALLIHMTPGKASASTPTEPFRHDDWTAVLERFVDPRGLVDYEGLLRDRTVFDRYVATIESTSPRSHPERFPTRADALAYYLNAYNASVFKGVLERGPEKKSVWRGLVSGLNFFVLMKVQVGGERMSLKYLEDELIRRGFEDPRIHAALNCASISCPRLPREAFAAKTLDTELDAAMHEFVSAPQHLEVDHQARVVRLSGIFDFFPKDFLEYERAQGSSDPRLLDYVNRYRSADDQIDRDYKVTFLKYDKGINAQR